MSTTRGLPSRAAAAPPAVVAASFRRTCAAACLTHRQHNRRSLLEGLAPRHAPLPLCPATPSQRLAATVPLAAATSSQLGTRPANCDPSAYQGLSLVVLLHECIQRAYGRPLLPACKDALSLPAQLDSLQCCVVILAPPPQPLKAATSRSLAGGSVEANPAELGSGRSSQPGPEGGDAESGEPSTSGRPGVSGRRGRLHVPYLNLAAAQALKLMSNGSTGTGGSSSGSDGKGGNRGPATEAPWRRMASSPLEAEESSDWLRTVLAAEGGPRRGQRRTLRLRTGGCAEDGHGQTASSTITCPEALVLDLMSPNGTCGGVAVLFDRWEVRGDGGAVLLEGRPLVPELPPGAVPDETALADLQDRVRGKADAVRALKSAPGRTNQDPEVVAAVAELQRLKAELELKQRLRDAFAAEPGVVRQLAAAVE